MSLLMTEFVSQLNEFEKEVHRQKQQMHVEKLKQLSHKLRGSASATHMKKLVELTLLIEDHNTPKPKLQALLGELETEIKNAQRISKEFVENT